MAITVTFHDFKKGQSGVGGSTTPVNSRPIDHLGATYRGEVEGYFTPDNSYPTGGYAVPAKSLGLQSVAGVMVEPSGGYTFQYNRTTGKLQAFSGAAEVANATNLSALQPAYFKAFGVIL